MHDSYYYLMLMYFFKGAKSKAFKCTVCKAAYTTRSHLKFHMYKHTGDYPYNCEYCNKGFAGRSQYRYHVLRHSGQSPYICKECGGRFWKKRNLEVHCSKHRCDNAPQGLQKCAVCCISLVWILIDCFFAFFCDLHTTYRPVF